MVEKKFLISKGDHKTLNAVIYTTENSLFQKENQKSPLVILCHGFTGDKFEYGRYTKVARMLNQEGFDALIFDFSGSGENERELVLLSKQVHDLEIVHEWAKNQKYSWIAIIALSFGGLTAFMTDLLDIKTLILWAPALNFRMTFEDESRNLFIALKALRKRPLKLPTSDSGEPIIVDKSFMDDLMRYDVVSRLKSFSIPTLIVQGMLDTVVKPEYTREMFSYLPKSRHHELIEVPNASHEFDGEQLNQFINISIKWLKNYI